MGRRLAGEGGGGAGSDGKAAAQSVLRQHLKWLKWEERLVTTQVGVAPRAHWGGWCGRERFGGG